MRNRYLFNDRMVEMVFVLENIKHGVVLDVGSRGSVYIKSLINLGCRAWTCEVQKNVEDYYKGNIRHLCCDIRKIEKPRFDSVIMVSTLEHIGLKGYGMKKEKTPFQSQLEAVNHSMKLLRKGGMLIITVPYGRFVDGGWYYVYDEEMVRKVKAQGKVKEERYYKLFPGDTFDGYEECSSGECWNKGLQNDRSWNICCLALEKR